MENKEIMTEEINENEEIEVYTEPEESGSRILGKVVIGALVVVGAGVAALIYKNKGKLDERRIRKLEKKGYIIQRPIDADTDVDDEVEEVE